MQSKLGTGMTNPYIVTWAELPQSQCKHEWLATGMWRHCCQLRQSLYGHPMNCKYVEDFAEKLNLVGFEIFPGWECFCAHQEFQIVVFVYMVDFKYVGKAEHLATGYSCCKVLDSHWILQRFLATVVGASNLS